MVYKIRNKITHIVLMQQTKTMSKKYEVVYRASVTETGTGRVNTYIGMTGRAFKDRWKEHKHDIR